MARLHFHGNIETVNRHRNGYEYETATKRNAIAIGHQLGGGRLITAAETQQYAH
jgi:hypothetical protein